MTASVSHVGRLRDADPGSLLRTYRYLLLLFRPIRMIVLNKRSGERLHVSPAAASTQERSIARRKISIE